MLKHLESEAFSWAMQEVRTIRKEKRMELEHFEPNKTINTNKLDKNNKNQQDKKESSK